MFTCESRTSKVPTYIPIKIGPNGITDLANISCASVDKSQCLSFPSQDRCNLELDVLNDPNSIAVALPWCSSADVGNCLTFKQNSMFTPRGLAASAPWYTRLMAAVRTFGARGGLPAVRGSKSPAVPVRDIQTDPTCLPSELLARQYIELRSTAHSLLSEIAHQLLSFSADDVARHPALQTLTIRMQTLENVLNTLPESYPSCCSGYAFGVLKPDGNCCARTYSNKIKCACGASTEGMSYPYYLVGNNTVQCNFGYGCAFRPATLSTGVVTDDKLTCDCVPTHLWNSDSMQCQPDPSKLFPSCPMASTTYNTTLKTCTQCNQYTDCPTGESCILDVAGGFAKCLNMGTIIDQSGTGSADVIIEFTSSTLVTGVSSALLLSNVSPIKIAENGALIYSTLRIIPGIRWSITSTSGASWTADLYRNVNLWDWLTSTIPIDVQTQMSPRIFYTTGDDTHKIYMQPMLILPAYTIPTPKLKITFPTKSPVYLWDNEWYKLGSREGMTAMDEEPPYAMKTIIRPNWQFTAVSLDILTSNIIPCNVQIFLNYPLGLQAGEGANASVSMCLMAPLKRNQLNGPFGAMPLSIQTALQTLTVKNVSVPAISYNIYGIRVLGLPIYPGGGMIKEGTVISTTNPVKSPNGTCILRIESGALEVVDVLTGKQYWSSARGMSIARAVLNGGNLILNSSTTSLQWSGSVGGNSTYMAVHDEGYLGIYSPSGCIWNSFSGLYPYPNNTYRLIGLGANGEMWMAQPPASTESITGWPTWSSMTSYNSSIPISSICRLADGSWVGIYWLGDSTKGGTLYTKSMITSAWIPVNTTSQLKRIVQLSNGTLWGIAMDGLQYTATSLVGKWTYTGDPGLWTDICQLTDGTRVALTTQGQVYYKTAAGNWDVYIGGAFKSITQAPSDKTLYAVGMDSNVYRKTSTSTWESFGPTSCCVSGLAVWMNVSQSLFGV